MYDEENYVSQKIDNIVEPTNIISHIFYLKNKYIDELKDYEYIDIKNIKKVQMGGFIRCCGKDDKLFLGWNVN